MVKEFDYGEEYRRGCARGAGGEVFSGNCEWGYQAGYGVAAGVSFFPYRVFLAIGDGVDGGSLACFCSRFLMDFLFFFLVSKFI